MKKMLTIILLFNIVFSLKIPPDNFKKIDNPYRNDIDFETEKDHHIITAIAAKEYIDYYKGIFYKSFMYCNWSTSCGLHPTTGSSIKEYPNYNELLNINDTNLKKLHRYGCTGPYPLNIAFDYRKEAEDSRISVSMRLTNTDIENEVEFQVGICTEFESNYNENCNKIKEFDKYTIPENSLKVITIQLGQNGFYKETENFEIFHSHTFNWKDHIRIFIKDEENKLTLNSYIISVDLFRYVLSLAGHAHNYCTNHGCLSGQYCVAYSTPAPTYYRCRSESCNSYRYYTECSLFGCIPGSFCDDSYTCIECDYQCRTCFSKGYMDCKSCYSIAEYPQWDYYHQFTKGTQCTFEFYPLNKIESYNIDVPIPLSYRVTMEFWMFIHDPTYLTNKDLRSSLSSFILKDFFTFSLRQNTSDYNSVNMIITPFEFFFPFKKSYTTADDFLNDYLVTYPTLKYLDINVKEVTSKWIYIRAGISYTHKKMFINENENEFDSFPMYYQNDEVRRYDKTYLRVQGFEYINTDVYVRNLNFYSDYMFNHVNYPNYFNLHLIKENGGNILTYPQLMFSIPYTKIKIDPTKLFVYYHLYDNIQTTIKIQIKLL